MRSPLLLCLLALGCTGALGQTYRWTDAAGHTVISDSPPPGGARNVETAGGGSSGKEMPFALRRAMERYPVTLYTAPDCAAPCQQAQALLTGRGVPFTEKALKKPADFDELKGLVGDAFVPSLKVGDQFVRGFEASAYDKLLDIAGYPKAQAGSPPAR